MGMTAMYATMCQAQYQNAIICAETAPACAPAQTSSSVSTGAIQAPGTAECLCNDCPLLQETMGSLMDTVMSAFQGLAGGGQTQLQQEEQERLMCALVGPMKCAANSST